MEKYEMCNARYSTGWCTHVQCPYPEKTGGLCVEIVDTKCFNAEVCEADCQYKLENEEED